MKPRRNRAFLGRHEGHTFVAVGDRVLIRRYRSRTVSSVALVDLIRIAKVHTLPATPTEPHPELPL